MTATLPERPAARDPRAPFELTHELGGLDPEPVHTDRLLLGAALALALIGAVLVWAATRGTDGSSFLVRHLFNTAVGVVIVAGVARIDVRILRGLAPFGYAAGLLGLIAVLIVGSTVNGAKAWIDLGSGFQLQPSEFMKITLIVAVAALFCARAERRAENGDERTEPITSDILIALAMLGAPLGLIMLQPDLGSALVLCAAAFGVLLVAGIASRWLVGLLAAAGGAAVLAVHLGLLATYQLDRFKAFTNPGHDPLGAAYNITQARIAIANGGLFGTGLFHGPQTNGGFVPEQQTDFVFSVAGEEFGLVGGAVIIVLVGIICWRGLVIARRADRFGQLVAVGVVCWIGFQTFENVGMNLGLTPVTGVPLPLVSYGGSSMFAEALALGLLVAIGRRAGQDR